MKSFYFSFLSLVLLLSCQPNNNSLEKTPLINISTANDSLTIFGENVISTPLYERDLAINPQSDEIIYTLGDYKQSKRCLVVLSKENGKWTKPKIMPISGKYHDIEPFYTQNGNRLFFASNRPIYKDSTRSDYNIWYSDKKKGVWSEPAALDSVINTRGDEFFPSVSEKGNLYFTATRKNGLGKEDIFISKYVEGKFQSPEPLPVEINSPFFEFNAYVSPKEDLIIFSSFGREDDLGGGDLYISRKDDDGKWSQSKNMGALINSDKLDYSPFIDWENRNFYFTSERKTNHDRELKSVYSLKQIANSPLNGFGNIFKIGLDEIEKLD
ncbi:MAG: exo-alpha-sialidase [Arenibacter latericius]|nr:exo-alpha-sialidase [Arenibacter latericius]